MYLISGIKEDTFHLTIFKQTLPPIHMVPINTEQLRYIIPL